MLVENLSAVYDDGIVSISWTNIPGSPPVFLYKSVDKIKWKQINPINIVETNGVFTVSGLDPEISYYFGVATTIDATAADIQQTGAVGLSQPSTPKPVVNKYNPFKRGPNIRAMMVGGALLG